MLGGVPRPAGDLRPGKLDTAGAVVDICLVPPAVPLTDVERQELGGWRRPVRAVGARAEAQAGRRPLLPAQTIAVAPDPHAREARKAYGDLLAALRRSGYAGIPLCHPGAVGEPLPPVTLASALTAVTRSAPAARRSFA